MLDMFKGFQRVLITDTSTLACVPNPKSTTWHFLIWNQGEKVSLDCFGPCSLGLRDAVLPKSPPKFESHIFVMTLDTQLWRGKGPSVSNPPQIFLAKAAPWKCLVFHIGGPENFKFQKKQLPQQRANLTTSPHFFEGSENNLTWTCTSKNQQEIKSWMGQRWESPKYEWQFSRRRVTIQIADVLIDLDRQFLYLDPISQSRFGKKKPYTGPGGVL